MEHWTALAASKSGVGVASLFGLARLALTRTRLHPTGRAWAVILLLLRAASAASKRLDTLESLLTGLSGIAVMVLSTFKLNTGDMGECNLQGRAVVSGVAHLAAFAMAAICVVAAEAGLSRNTGPLLAIAGSLLLATAGWVSRSTMLLVAALLQVVGMVGGLLPASTEDHVRGALLSSSRTLSVILFAYCIPRQLAYRGDAKVGAAEKLLKADPASSAAPKHAAEPWEPWLGEWLLLQVHRYLWASMTRLPPRGPFKLKLRHAINAHKAASTPTVLLLMAARGAWGAPAWVYLGMHGGYGVAWLIKEATFPDSTWGADATLGGCIYLFFSMSLFWIAPFCVIDAEARGMSTPPPTVAAALYLFSIGMLFLHAADSQKTFILKHSERRGLIRDGLFGRTRNPNYFGEVLIYSSFSMMASTSRLWFLPWCVNSFVWFALFLPSWLVKDRSLSRHPGFRAYQRRTGVLIPWVFGTGWWPELSCDTSGTGGVSAWVC